MQRESYAERLNRAMLGFGTGAMQARKQRTAEAEAARRAKAEEEEMSFKREFRPFQQRMMRSQAEAAEVEAQQKRQEMATNKLKTDLLQKWGKTEDAPEYTPGDPVMRGPEQDPEITPEEATEAGLMTPEAKKRDLAKYESQYLSLLPMKERIAYRKDVRAEEKEEREAKEFRIKEEQRELLQTEAVKIAQLPQESQEKAAKEMLARHFPEKYLSKAAWQGSIIKDMFDGMLKLEREKRMGEVIKLKGKGAQEERLASINMQKVGNIMRNLHVKGKAARKQGFQTQGPITGGLKQLLAYGRFEGFEKTGAYDGQLSETAAAMMRLITGSVRFVAGFYEHLRRSLPKHGDTDTYAANKVAQSVHNSFGLAKAAHKFNMGKELDSGQYDSNMKEFRVGDQVFYVSDETSDKNSDINQQFLTLAPEPLTKDERLEAEKWVKHALGPEDYEKYKHLWIDELLGFPGEGKVRDVGGTVVDAETLADQVWGNE